MPFKTIGLIGKPAHEGANKSLNAILQFLKRKGCRILVETKVSGMLQGNGFETAELENIGLQADLAIVVGGDGNMLGAARILAKHDVAVVGVNRGNLGFLTDIHPDDIDRQLTCLFNGEFVREQRFILQVDVFRDGIQQSSNSAINEVVLHHGKVAHMMEFEVYIDDNFVFSQRSDGLIVATPTGSTAYSLSGGGPILTPNLDALTLVPMFPHTLSSRPIVVDANSVVRMKVSNDNTDNLQVSCDSHIALTVFPGDEIHIKKNQDRLSLIHPKDYNYFNVLRTKLGWGSKLY
ncbi:MULTISPECIES: NAD(+) kinase [Aliiglaciecola]|uniref:NAD(+) kinase n=1 Tax=Aliiglaciecola TaxID=1406885 RepID=UPI001C09F30B|nr:MULTISPECIES: NAD(+) kinase [Aliiglaciecola]MBU2878180.1 NAD(+) kinase [Aliiglaciecola lipolytica]MDO6711641.1 NAD(+) kinase [Aliiglaciecola sp. 2_MG-2023]MDO6752712.1 NAD(+) kinase [Aliiglaciecola sp. 1_MG-2023]